MEKGYNLGQAGTLSPEDYAQQQSLNRQQQMAQLLLQQGMQQPQGQMVSGRYVPTSFFQNLVPLANLAASQYIGNKADTEAAKLAERIRQGKATAEEKITNLTLGTPDVATELAGPYAGKVPMPVAIKEGTKPDLAAALKAINDPYSYGAGKDLKPLIYKQLMPEPTPEEKRYRAAIADGSFKGGFNAFLNQMSEKDKASIAIDRARLGIAQQELAFNTGMGMGSGQGGGGGQVNMGAQGNNQFAPKTVEQYQYNPALTGKQNQEQAGKFYENLQKNTTNAKDSFDLMKSAGTLLSSNAPSSGLISNTLTTVGEALNLPFGARKQESEADAQLKMLSGALTMKQPRFEGPQGVLDVTLYQKLAGDLGNANIPVESRLATMKQMVDLQKKYYPGGDWDSIQTKLDSASKVSLGAAQPVYATNPQTGARIMSNDGGKTWNSAR
jgi:hypothetical protein